MSILTYAHDDATRLVSETFKGLVLTNERERNYHDDSDFYCLVWDEERQTITEVGTGTTRFGCAPTRVEADATPEVIEKATAYARRLALDDLLAEDEQLSRQLDFGREVEVVRGRKVAKGTRGEILRMQDGQWGRSLLLRLQDGSTVWTAARNVELLNPDQYLTPREELEALANKATFHYYLARGAARRGLRYAA